MICCDWKWTRLVAYVSIWSRRSLSSVGDEHCDCGNEKQETTKSRIIYLILDAKIYDIYNKPVAPPLQSIACNAKTQISMTKTSIHSWASPNNNAARFVQKRSRSLVFSATFHSYKSSKPYASASPPSHHKILFKTHPPDIASIESSNQNRTHRRTRARLLFVSPVSMFHHETIEFNDEFIIITPLRLLLLLLPHVTRTTKPQRSMLPTIVLYTHTHTFMNNLKHMNGTNCK